MNLFLAFWFVIATAFPSAQKSGWMAPESFHLKLGMSRAKVQKQLNTDGWSSEAGKGAGQLVIRYGEANTVTLGFYDNRLHSIRFEMVDFLQNVKSAFGEQKSRLARSYGKPSVQSTSRSAMLLYEKTIPKVHVVLSTDHNSRFGRQGLGFLVVRYFEPPPAPR